MRIKQFILFLLVLSSLVPISFQSPVIASVGAPRIGAIDSNGNLLLANSSVSITAGELYPTSVDSSPAYSYSFAIFFSYGNDTLVTFSGAQFSLYLSKNGYSSISPDDVPYASDFFVNDLYQGFPTNITCSNPTLKGGSAIFQLGTEMLHNPSTGENMSCRVLVGPVPIGISADYKYVKIFDGASSLIAVSSQVVNILPYFALTPESGSAGTFVTVNGTGLPEGRHYGIYYMSPISGLVAEVAANSIGLVNYSWNMADLANNFSIDPVQTIAITVRDLVTNSSVGNLTFTEYSRVFTLIQGESNATNSGNGTATVDVKALGSLLIAGDYFNPGNISFSIGNVVLGTASVYANSSFNATFEVPPLTNGLHTVSCLNNGVSYTFKVNALPTLIGAPASGPVGSMAQLQAYSFLPNTTYYIYWYGLSMGDGTWYNLANATTNSTGQFSTSITIPSSYGGSHAVAATSSFSGNSNGSIAIYAFTTFTSRPAFNYMITFQLIGIGSDYVGPVLTIDGNSYTAAQLPQSITWTEGTLHNYSWSSPLLSSSSGKRYIWSSTSGIAANQSGSILVSGAGTLTGSFQIQYQLIIQASPSNGGIVAPSGTTWQNSNNNVQLNATPLQGFTFERWGGDLASSQNPLVINMTGPKSIVANFEEMPHDVQITFQQSVIGSDSVGTVLVVDGTSYMANQLPLTLTWLSGTSHNYSWSSPAQTSLSGKRYAWLSSSGLAGNQSGMIIAPHDNGYITASYQTQFKLVVQYNATSGNAIPSGINWYNVGTTVQLNATPALEYYFANWSGSISSQESSYQLIINSEKAVAANFVPKNIAPVNISLVSSSMVTGNPITISGTIGTYIPVNITLLQSINGSGFSYFASVSAINGSFQYTFTPSGTGTYKFKANWTGNNEYRSAESSEAAVQVIPPPMDYTLYVIVIAVTAVVLVVVAYLLRSRRK
ncbi:MAG: hypothetical protein LUP94_00915 [Candidatus Methanomethylicus sp.]|nr:hypothetical protein [Candidatus Methanomethylicus sp.]